MKPDRYEEELEGYYSLAEIMTMKAAWRMP
jgi:hypothetical protein